MSSFQSMDSLIWLPIYISALLSKSTDQGFALITDAWIQSSWLFNGTTYTCSKLFSLAVKLLAWLYDWAFIAHCYSPSPCLQWNASGVYTPHRGLSVIAEPALLCGDQYVRGWQLSSDELHLLSLRGGTLMFIYIYHSAGKRAGAAFLVLKRAQRKLWRVSQPFSFDSSLNFTITTTSLNKMRIYNFRDKWQLRICQLL